MLRKISLDEIHRNPSQPRQHFDQAALIELADSIEENGLLQPITVRPDKDAGGYMVIAGERRFRAHLILRQRGVTDTILVHIRRMDDETMHVQAILENLQRVDVSPLEKGRAFQRMIDDYGYTPETLAKKVGLRTARHVTEFTDLLKLADDHQELLKVGVLTFGQGVAMAKLEPRQQREFLDFVKTGKSMDYPAACKLADAIQRRDAQGGFFSEEEAPVARARDEERMSRIEKALEQAAAAVARCFDDGELTVAGQLDPARFDKAAERAKLLRKHLTQIESALGHGGTVARLSVVKETADAA